MRRRWTRWRNTPLAEAIIAGTAVGAAASGLRPVIVTPAFHQRDRPGQRPLVARHQAFEDTTLPGQINDLATDAKGVLWAATSDGLLGEEGTFNICTFWLVEALTRAGRLSEARLIFERMLGYFAEARERYAELKANPGIVDEILAAGADKLAPVAAETLAECHERMGLAPRR